MAEAFKSADTTPVMLGPKLVPTNVFYICVYTWMCTLSDIHANDAGYALIGQTVVARLE